MYDDIDSDEKIDIPIMKMPQFQFSQKDIILFSEKMEHHVSNIHPKKKTLLLAFKTYTSGNLSK